MPSTPPSNFPPGVQLQQHQQQSYIYPPLTPPTPPLMNNHNNSRMFPDNSRATNIVTAEIAKKERMKILLSTRMKGSDMNEMDEDESI